MKKGNLGNATGTGDTCNSKMEKTPDIKMNEPFIEAPEGPSNESDDFCREYLNSLDWNRPIQRTTNMTPWIGEDEWKLSLAHKYMNYEMEPNYIDLENPLLDGPMIEDLRKKESRRKNKKKDKSNEEYSVIKEGVVEVDTKEPVSSESEDNFLDEFGNIREDAPEQSSDNTSDSNVLSSSNPPEGRKRGKKHKKQKKRGKKEKILRSDRIKDICKDTADEVMQRSNKLFIDHDLAPADETSNSKNQDNQSKQSSNIDQPDISYHEKHVTAAFQFEEPKKSCLNSKEQRAYIALLEKFQAMSREAINAMLGSDKQNDIQDWKIFQSYRDYIKEEQEEFQTWCKEVFIQRGNSSVENLHVDVRRYIDEYHEQRLNRVPKQIPRLYTSLVNLQGANNVPKECFFRLIPPVSEQRKEESRFEMRFDKWVCQLGYIPKVIFPKESTLMRGKHILPRNYHVLIKKYPTFDSKFTQCENKIDGSVQSNDSVVTQDRCEDNITSKELYKTNISFDKNAEKLAVQYRPDIVISVSSLKTIFDNFGPNFERDWEIPITIWMIAENRRVILIDKPLPRKKLNTEDKLKWHSKIATKCFLLHPFSQLMNTQNEIYNAEQSSAKNNDRMCKKYDDLNMFQVDGINDDSSSDENPMVIAEVNNSGESDESHFEIEIKKPIPELIQRQIGIDNKGRSTKLPANNIPLRQSSPEKANAEYPTNPAETKSKEKVTIGNCEPKQNFDLNARKMRSLESHRPDDYSTTACSNEKVVCGNSGKKDIITKELLCNCGHASRNKRDLDQHILEQSEDSDKVSEEEEMGFMVKAVVDGNNQIINTTIDKITKEKNIPGDIVVENESKENSVTNKSLANGTSDTFQEATNLNNESQNPISESRKESPLKETEKVNKLDEILQRTKREKYQKNMRSYKQELSDESNLLPGIMAAQTKTSQKTRNHHVPGNNKELRESMNHFQGLTLQAENGDDSKDFIQPADGTNVNYALWRLRKKIDPNLTSMKNQKQPTDESLVVLVRSKFHGARIELPHFNPPSTLHQLYTVDCKLENQPEHGVEQISKSQLAREWIGTLVRPESKLARMRASSLNGSVLMTETKSLKELTNDGRKLDFEPDVALGNIYTLFSELRKLPDPTNDGGVDRYLLQHDAKSGAFVKVYKAADACQNTPKHTGKEYDVHLAYNIHSNETKSTPQVDARWVPIDVDVITPHHKQAQRAPGLFAPKEFRHSDKENGNWKKAQRGRSNFRGHKRKRPN